MAELRYISTRGGAGKAGKAKSLNFAGVLAAGPAADGGLYVPAVWPALAPGDIAPLAGRPYADLALRVMQPFIGGAIPAAKLHAIVNDAYAGFAHQSVAPLRQIGPNRWLMELFHGPTLSFKDIALQLLARLFDHVIAGQGERATILGATSGDTGSAAIAACRGRQALDIFILYPEGRVSDVQRRQMTTVADANVHAIAVAGTFDDCQALVKAAFADAGFRRDHNLTAVNSINWARVMAQTVYYFAAALALGAVSRPISFAVPTGNFGDAYAGYVAARMGLPVERLIVATNRNDILARFFATGDYRSAKVTPTISPSMDIQVASNFERLLFDLCGRDGGEVAALMGEFSSAGGFTLGGNRRPLGDWIFAARKVDEKATLAAIADCYRDCGLIVDPHTAVGLAAAKHLVAPGAANSDVPVVHLATAHPAKFPEAVQQAIGRRPEVPDRLAAVMQLPEKLAALPADLGALKHYIKRHRSH